jgi:hypothetical protein
MTDERDRAQREPEDVHDGKRATANAGVLEHQIDHERIARRAYEIYESRGRADGHADYEWVQSASEYADGVRANQRRADRCPRCSAFCGTPNLLTSMTRYYVCGGCGWRWQVSRIGE